MYGYWLSSERGSLGGSARPPVQTRGPAEQTPSRRSTTCMLIMPAVRRSRHLENPSERRPQLQPVYWSAGWAPPTPPPTPLTLFRPRMTCYTDP